MDILFARRFDVPGTCHNNAVLAPQPSMNVFHSEDKFIFNQSLVNSHQLLPKKTAFGLSVLFGRKGRVDDTLTIEDLWPGGEIPGKRKRPSDLWIAQELWEALIRYKKRQSEPIVKPVVPPPLSELVEKFGYTENWVSVSIRKYFPKESRVKRGTQRAIDLSLLPDKFSGKPVSQVEEMDTSKGFDLSDWENQIQDPAAKEIWPEVPELKTVRSVYQYVLQGIRSYKERHSDAAMIILPDIPKAASHLKIAPEKLLEALRVVEVNHEGLLFVDHKHQLFLVDLRAL